MASDAFYEAYVTVLPSAAGFEKNLNKQLAGPSTAAGNAAGKTAGVGFVGAFGKALPVIGGVLAAAGIGDLIGNAISDGANQANAQSAVEQVFGDLGASAIKSFAETAAENVGQSMSQVFQSASLLGVFGKAAGLEGAGLADFSEDLITLGADLAAFKNTSPEQAVEALGAGLRGESEPLRAYGVLLDDATLKARALEMGIYDGNGPLTQQQRILAAYNEILAQTTDVQGQYAKESDSLPGMQAEMAARWADVSAAIGTAFLPIAEDLVGFVQTDLVPALEDFAAWLNSPEGQEGLENFGGMLREVGNFARDMANAFMDTYGLISGVVGLFNGLSFEDFKNKMVELPGFWGMVFRAAEDAATGVWNAVNSMILGVRRFVADVQTNITLAVNWFQSLPGRIQQAVGNAGSWLYNAGRQVIEGFVGGITSMVGRIQRAITDTVGGAIEWAKDLLGIASPSKVFQQIGEYTSQGFARGIESEYGMVRAATSGMTSAATETALSFDGARIGGTLEIGGDGLGRIINGHIYEYDAMSGRRDDAMKRVLR